MMPAFNERDFHQWPIPSLLVRRTLSRSLQWLDIVWLLAMTMVGDIPAKAAL